MRLTRFTAFRAALFLAVGFVVLRVVYRIIFGGAGGAGLVLLDVHPIRLPPPFQHVSLFGEVTTGGIANAATSAIPFAILVLVTGLLAVIVDLRSLLSRGAVRGPVRTIARALVLAWTAIPALVESVRRVHVARELRGERGAAALLVPVLEQSIERAIALGASMEVRGFAASRRPEPVCEHPATMRDAALGFDGRWILENVTLELAPGSLTLVTGATGTGKSTFLHALSGVFQHVSGGEQRGDLEVAGVDRVEVPPRDTAGFVGVVSQSPRMSFVAATVREEIGFALAIRNVAGEIVAARVNEVAARLGITRLIERDVAALSAGEACLVAIAAAIIQQPVLLLVDEPLADLDTLARTRVISELDRLAHQGGVCVVVVEHALNGWGAVPDARLEVSERSMHPARAEVPVEVLPVALPLTGARVADIRGIHVAYGDRVVIDNADLTLHSRELVALEGPNGAGKSSLLHAIARPTKRGTVIVDGRDVRDLKPRLRRTQVALVPEAFDDMLFAPTVGEECARADRRAAGADTAGVFARLLGLQPDDPRQLMARHPRDLSAGERLCLVLAIQLSATPSVLLVDEPSRGLDAAARRLVGSALVAAAASGTAVVMATHDREFAVRYSTRRITMDAGVLDSRMTVPS